MAGKISNREIEALLLRISLLLEIKGENYFRVNAYRNAAEAVSQTGYDISTLVEEGRVKDLQGIGEAIALKITEYVENGSLEYYDNLVSEVPESLTEIADLPEMGAKRIAALWKKLGITNLEQLKDAAEKGRIREVEGFGQKLEKKILDGIKSREGRSSSVRYSIAEGWYLSKSIIEGLSEEPAVLKISPGGSLRRMKETIGDIDILAASTDAEKVMEKFVSLPVVREVLLKGSTKTSIISENGIQVDLRVVDPESWGTALQYFTGSREHNVKLRELSLKKGFSLSEYALAPVSGEEKKFFDNEDDLYSYLGLRWIPPELRQNGSEIVLAAENQLPELVNISDIKGDLQSHSDWSDGKNTLEEMAEGARSFGLEYLLVTDHSAGLGIAGGITGDELRKQSEAIDRINRKYKNSFRLLKGVEVEVKSDGSLDIHEKYLEELDLVVAAVHTSRRQEREVLTARYLKAIENPYVNILAHPTGRLIGVRDEVDVDWDRIFRAAADTGTLLEINANPRRLDLPDRLIKRALELGCSFIISTDSHSIEHFDFLRFGVGTARRGGLTGRNVANTKKLKDFMSFLKRQQ